MKPGKYTIKELFADRSIEQIIIPEIQRDYVWKEQQVKGLISSLILEYETFKNSAIIIKSDDEQVVKDFTHFYKQQKFSSNIGFIYAYNDVEYKGKYFLIDGQQRLTTIYLLLLALSVKAGKNSIEEFRRFYFVNDVLKLDYKVREAAHNFITKFLDYVLVNGNATNIENQFWYFASYSNDKTIQSILTNFRFIYQFIETSDTLSFLYYVQNHVEFWYFDTNISEQGEELYIYMNARGEQMQSNENIKATLLSTINNSASKNESGKSWENWQDFFWENRDENENADYGFNNFLKCSEGIENYLKNTEISNNREKSNIALVNFETLTIYINALKYLLNYKETFCRQYIYSDWVDIALKEIWKILNSSKINWNFNLKDSNSTGSREMVYIWSFFYYFKQKGENIQVDESFRFLRFFYIRYNNNNRSVKTLKNTIDLILTNGVIDKFDNQLSDVDYNSEEETDKKFRTLEETAKYSFLSNFVQNENLLKQYEQVIWQIEDHSLNITGKDLSNVNCSHLVNFSKNPDLESLKRIKSTFYSIFPLGLTKNYHLLSILLLHYSDYWVNRNKNYYTQLQFDKWERIIRNKDGQAFSMFFEEVLYNNFEINIGDILKQKRIEFLNENLNILFDISTIREQLIVYSILIDNFSLDKYYIGEMNEEGTKLFDKESELRLMGNDFRADYDLLFNIVIKKYGNDREIIKEVLKSKLLEFQTL